jgi:hypothetical protein
MVGLEAITGAATKEAATARHRRKRTRREATTRKDKSRCQPAKGEPARRCWIIPFLNSVAEVRCPAPPTPNPAPNPLLLLPSRNSASRTRIFPWTAVSPEFSSHNPVQFICSSAAEAPQAGVFTRRGAPVSSPLLVLDGHRSAWINSFLVCCWW